MRSCFTFFVNARVRVPIKIFLSYLSITFGFFFFCTSLGRLFCRTNIITGLSVEKKTTTETCTYIKVCIYTLTRYTVFTIIKAINHVFESLINFGIFTFKIIIIILTYTISSKFHDLTKSIRLLKLFKPGPTYVHICLHGNF